MNRVPSSLDKPVLEVGPDKVQKKFQELKFGMFVHFGLNTFYSNESSDGDLPLYNFNPEIIDTNQWCMTAKNAGMNYILINAKSSDGFCNWPSKYSNYTVDNTPFKTDILSELINSAEKYGLKTGFSYSLYDGHVFIDQMNEDIYNEYIVNQVTELLSEYGPLVEIWFDGFWHRQNHGWKAENGFAVPMPQFLNSWRNEGAYRWKWDYLYSIVKNLQPETMVFNNPTRLFRGLPLFPVDGRAAEKGEDLEVDQPIWNWLGEDVYLPLQIETTLSQKGKKPFYDGNWFWDHSDKSVAKKWKIRQWLKNAGKLNANLVLNVGPMANGKLRPEDEKVLLRFSE